MYVLHRMYCGWQKGTSQDEATPNSENIKPMALSIVKAMGLMLSIVKLCLTEGIS